MSTDRALTGYVSDPRFVEHDTGPAHPERPGRLTAIQAGLEASGALAELDALLPSEAAEDTVRSVHVADHVETVRAVCARSPAAIDGDTRVSPGSWSAALAAVGGVEEACGRVLGGSWRNAFCSVRPPGHHAERDRAMGFCLFNNVAIAARSLVERHGLERVAIVDWDVHHGNGTQHIFEDEARVYYVSLHQHPLYPGTGAASERGRGAGEGTTLNCPLPGGTGDTEWLDAFEGTVLPALEDYGPEFVLISAGFDAHRLDPLAGVLLSEEAYRVMTRRLLELARKTAGGRLVSVLEGGYSFEALASSVAAHVGELLADRGP